MLLCLGLCVFLLLNMEHDGGIRVTKWEFAHVSVSTTVFRFIRHGHSEKLLRPPTPAALKFKSEFRICNFKIETNYVGGVSLVSCNNSVFVSLHSMCNLTDATPLHFVAGGEQRNPLLFLLLIMTVVRVTCRRITLENKQSSRSWVVSSWFSVNR